MPAAPEPVIAPPSPPAVRAFIVGFFVYELLYILGAFSTQYFFLLGESHRAISLGLLIVLTLLLRRARSTDPPRIPWYDYVLMAAGAAGCFYIAPTPKIVELQTASPIIGAFELTIGIVTLLVLLEGTRRVSGPVLPGLLVGVVLYAMFADRFPGVLYGRAHSFTRVIGEVYLSLDGIFGSVMRLWTRILVVFIVFGAFLQTCGAGRFFIDLALALTGHLRGGPAKVAILASGLFGTISGSAAADVATTGVVTVPMMRRLGYRPEFAGAVEAVASTGGVLMPPMMGMVAFMVAEFLDISYLEVCIAAAIPAGLYYLSLYLLVDFEARKSALEGLPRDALPDLGETWRRGWFFFMPMLVLVYCLAVLRYPPGLSALYGLGGLAIVASFRADTRLTWARVLDGFELAARNALVVAIICGSVGILIASIVITGAALRMGVLLVQASGGQLLPLLMLAGLASLVLGTGVPAIASYMLLAVTVAPAVVGLGVPPIGAHPVRAVLGHQSRHHAAGRWRALHRVVVLRRGHLAARVPRDEARHRALRRAVHLLLSSGTLDDRFAGRHRRADRPGHRGDGLCDRRLHRVLSRAARPAAAAGAGRRRCGFRRPGSARSHARARPRRCRGDGAASRPSPRAAAFRMRAA